MTAPAPSGAATKERVLESRPGRLVVEVEAGPFLKEAVEEAGAWRIACAGCGTAATGAPDLPMHRLDLRGAAGQAQVRMDILESEVWPAFPLAPVPRSLDLRRREFRMDPALEAAAAHATVRALPAALIRGMPWRGLLAPLALRSTDGSITILKRIRIEADWIPATPAPRRSARKAGSRAATADLGGRFLHIRFGDKTVDQAGEDRVYAVTFTELAKASEAIKGAVPLEKLRLYAGPADTLPRYMGGLAADPGSHPGRLREIPMEVAGDQNGTFDQGDTLRFFAHGTGLWKRIPGAAGPVRYAFGSDPYSFETSYYLAFDGEPPGEPLRLLPETSAPPSVPARETSRHYLRAEQDLATGGCTPDTARDSTAGFIWFWHLKGTCGTSLDTVLRAGQIASPAVASLPDFSAEGRADSDRVLIGFHSIPLSGTFSFRPWVGGSPGSLPPWEDNRVPGAWYAWEGPGNGEAFKLDSLSWSGPRFLDGYTVTYPRRLVYRGAPLWIFPEAAGGRLAWKVQGGAGLQCVRVVDGVADRLWRLDPEGRFSDSLPEDADARYLVYREASALPDGAVKEETREPAEQVLRDLWKGSTEGGGLPEYLILAPKALLKQALALRDYRRNAARAIPLRTSVVLVEDIYREFSSGRVTPTALRDFLRWALHRWDPAGAEANPLRQVVFFGNGHYDYRGLDAARSKESFPMYVPPYEGYAGIEPVAAEDFFARLDSGETDLAKGGLDLALGRLPFRNVEHAEAYLDKIKAYEDPVQGGIWRSKAVLASDDHIQRGRKDDLDGIPQGHVVYTEKVAKALGLREPALLLERVNMLDYPMNSSYRKPQASQDLVAYLNRGALAVNFFGHGSSDQWADEVLLQTADASSLTNRGRTGMVNSFSCTVGRFDTFVPGLSEALVTRAGGGAIASVSATRESYPDPNGALAVAFYERVFPGDSNTVPVTVGEALRAAKNQPALNPDGLNDSKYALLGEPVLLLRKPGLKVGFTARPDTVRALDCGRLEGVVEGGTGSGWINLKLSGGPTSKFYDLPAGMTDQNSDKRGAILFEQTVPYKDGRFSADYLIPSRVPFGDTGAVLAAFAWDGKREMEGSMAVTRLHVREGGKSSCADASDKRGPAIHITGCEEREAAGMDLPERIRIDLPGCLGITVTDSSGGVLTADGPDEGTTLEVPGVLDPFHPQPGVDELYRKTYRLALESRDFRPGSHVLKVSAQDGYGNRSLRLLRMDVTADSAILAFSARNVPNPVKRNGTAFYFSALLPSPDVEVTAGTEVRPARAEFEVRIFNQSGKVVKVLRQARSGVAWDAKDEWGNRLANGVYFYTVTARWEKERNELGGGRIVSTRRNTLVISR